MRMLARWAVVLLLLAVVGRVQAEGSRELDAADDADVNVNRPNDQSVANTTVFHVDILDGANEKICWNGTGSLNLRQPDDVTAVGAALTDGNCRNTVTGVNGAYVIRMAQNQVFGFPAPAVEWDIRVCDRSATDVQCFSDPVDPQPKFERLGRLWSYQWEFQNGGNYEDQHSINGSVYAIVTGGADDRDAVIEMQMRGVSGANYRLYANAIGPETSGMNPTRVGRSVLVAGNQVRPLYPLYLSPPQIAEYNWIHPVIADVVLATGCGTGVVQDTAAGEIRFTSNVVGQYVVICDVNDDGVYDFASQTDFSSFGTAAVGTNMISWDGTNNAGANAAPGTYECVVRLNVGEFHYTARDIETSYPGIRMFRLENDRTTRTPLSMFWDDTAVPVDPDPMDNNQDSPNAPPASGLTADTYATATSPFFYMGGDPSMPLGNGRAWGQFDSDSKGNDTFLDQFASADTAQSAAFMVNVLSAATDDDMDGLTSARECEIGSDPANADTDGDGVSDGVEASMSANPNSDNDGPPDVLDPDSDNDGVNDGVDVDRLDPNECRDMDSDMCDDCANTGADESGGDIEGDGTDTDTDGDCNTGDGDDDNDGVDDADDSAPLDATECRDEDGDACDDCKLTGSDGTGGDPEGDGVDSDADGLCDDGAGTPASGDPDDDNDGVADGDDAEPDVPTRCQDLDNDMCDDCALTAASGDGPDPANDGFDPDGDGICDPNPPDSDEDSVPDAIDLDRDNDGIPNSEEGSEDQDGDGIPNDLDLDSDDDGVLDIVEAGGADLDEDGDGRIDELVDESPEDGLHDPLQDDALPLPDTDGDGTPDFLDTDDDDDGVPTREELDEDGEPLDTDGDGKPNHLDADDDGDTIPTRRERTSGNRDRDTDKDGTPDRLDPDDDGDGIPTEDETGDADKNGIRDYLQPAEKGTLAGGALCSIQAVGASRGDGGSLVMLVMFGLWCARRRKRRARPVVFAVALGLMAQTSSASAQVALDQFKPAPLATDGFAIGRPTVLPHGTFGAVLLLDYANDPLVYERESGDPDSEQRVVEHDLVLHAGVAVGLWDRLALFINVPIHLVMEGDDDLTVPAPEADGAGLGDIVVGGRIRIAGEEQDAFGLAVEVMARVPTADLADDSQTYRGDSIGSYEPALIAELRSGAFSARVRAGARLREKVMVANLDLGQELVYGLGLRLLVAKPVSLHAEVYGSTYFGQLFEREHSPTEALFGAKVAAGNFHFGAAAGPGLMRGYGSPDVRVVGMLGYAEEKERGTPAPTPDTDLDNDGILDEDDHCPTEPEDRDRFEDTDGCPDPDNDRDGVLDVSDRCPNKPEDLDEFVDGDGCPDPDNDGDGILDVDDRCPNEAEDKDQFEDTDGCPDPDNDHDGILDAEDRCPNQPEDLDGWEDDDGCAEAGEGLVRLTCEKIEIKESVYFETGSDRIQERSFTLLSQVVGVLRHATQIKRLRVEGHTDDRGRDAYNLELSQRRAASVLAYLIEQGASADRLTSEGYGETKPIATNKTADGRTQNRRVEFVVLESDACR